MSRKFKHTQTAAAVDDGVDGIPEVSGPDPLGACADLRSCVMEWITWRVGLGDHGRRPRRIVETGLHPAEVVRRRTFPRRVGHQVVAADRRQHASDYLHITFNFVTSLSCHLYQGGYVFIGVS